MFVIEMFGRFVVKNGNCGFQLLAILVEDDESLIHRGEEYKRRVRVCV
jgi:hypothetical protein